MATSKFSESPFTVAGTPLLYSRAIIVVRLSMLQSVIATVNRLGLESLQLEDSTQAARPRDSSASLWAVVDSADLALVCRVLHAAEPEAALRLLAERAVSIGRLLT